MVVLRYKYKFQKSEIYRMFLYFDKLLVAPLSQKVRYDLEDLGNVDRLVMYKEEIEINDYAQTDELYVMMHKLRMKFTL